MFAYVPEPVVVPPRPTAFGDLVAMNDEDVETLLHGSDGATLDTWRAQGMAAIEAAHAATRKVKGGQAIVAADMTRAHAIGGVQGVAALKDLRFDRAGEAQRERRDSIRVLVLYTRFFAAIGERAAAGARNERMIEMATHERPAFRMENPILFKPDPELLRQRFDAVAWAKERADVLCNPARVRVDGRRLHVRGFDEADMKVLAEHQATLAVWIAGQFTEVQSEIAVMMMNTAR